MTQTNKAKILFMDIETAPETAYIWKRFDETVGQSQIKEPGYVLCISWMWDTDETPNIVSIYKGKAWREGDRTNDRAIIEKAWDLLDEADIVIGHNLKKFDIGTLNARFLYHNLPPPSPYKIVDTYLALKKNFQMPSKSLESSSVYFKLDDIKEKQGFTLWRDCLEGVDSSWKRMKEYCMHDVSVVRQLYYKLRPFMEQHPNIGLYANIDTPVCPKCGSDLLVKTDFVMTSTNRYPGYQCAACGGCCRSRTADKTKKIQVV